jgi:hypothetical protein
MPVLQRSNLSETERAAWLAREKRQLFNESLGTLLPKYGKLHEEIGKHRDEPPEERVYATDLALVQAEAIEQIILERHTPST